MPVTDTVDDLHGQIFRFAFAEIAFLLRFRVAGRNEENSLSWPQWPKNPGPSRPSSAVALLTLRFRLKKYAQHTFSTETERRKNSGSSQSLASLLRLTEPTNQID